MSQSLIITIGFVMPLIGGIWLPLADERDGGRVLARLFAFAPVLLFFLGLILLTGAFYDPLSFALLGAGLCFSYIPFFIGKTFGAALAQIRQERRDEVTRNIF